MSKWKMPEPLGAGAAARGGEGDLLSAIPTATEVSATDASATEVLAEEDAKLEDLEILKAALGSSKSSSSSV